MNKAYKFYAYTKKHGVGKAVRQTATYVSKKMKLSKLPIDVMADIDDIIKADFIIHPYLPPAKITPKTKLQIGWVLSPLSTGSGGQNTIARFARFLKQQGHEVTFYIYEGVQPQSLADAKKILTNSFHLDVAVKKIDQYKESDVIFATGWETAYPVFNLRTNAHKFYFVQDFEPLFYGMGSKSVLAENTYRMGFYGITAGRWLSHKLKTGYSMQADHFDFGADLDVYRPNDSVKLKKEKKIAFYARPVTERRAFELGVIALDIFHKKHPEYTIEFIGWDVSDYKIPFPYVNRGILNHHQLAGLYHKTAACLVLSLTNVSLLPLELLAAGCIPVMNEGDNNSMVLGDNEYIQYVAATPGQLAVGLETVISNEQIDETARRAADSVKDVDWNDSYKKMESIIKREVFKRG
jgi:O-antigen biosynthesis protein